MSIAVLEPEGLLGETVCQGCWLRPAGTKGLATGLARCGGCADANVPARVDLFPPLGIYRLTWVKIRRGETEARHRGPGAPQSPPDPGPPLPSPAPTPTPGRPPV
ncbi:hypothetical protein SCWH03_28830 [Streptomyces pacificus]|uniref:Uncharacterized protein n=1 Tax=Streptomyces pacificus TaxID=2705029 RepID=A0A6A0AUP9_9ACTN|nr:hypothetical protein SCWH03_28830 [Streptomyces pacificus]